MKISHIEAIPFVRALEDVFQGGTYKITSRNTIVTRIELDNGVRGETFGGDEDQYQFDVCRIVNEVFRPFLVGTDVRDVELHWQRMWDARIDLGNRGIHTLDLAKHCAQTQAIAAGDIAIWDAIGKALTPPVPPLMAIDLFANTGSARRVVKLTAGALSLVACLACPLAGADHLTTDQSRPDRPPSEMLVAGGKGLGAIVVGEAKSESEAFVAAELQRYIAKLTLAKLPIVSANKAAGDGPWIVVGGPKVNPLTARAELAGDVDCKGLKPEGFILKAVALDGHPALIVAGNDDAGTMYGAYDLLERLGMVFQIRQDIVPMVKPDLAFPKLDVRSEPVEKIRGLTVWHAYTWYRSLDDYRQIFDQMAKLKLNRLEFMWGMGAPFFRFSYEGKVAELTTTPESGYLAVGRDTRSWGHSPHTTTATRRDVVVGKEVFPANYVGAPEFADVRSPDDAVRTAESFLHQLIRLAHARHIQVSLLLGELSFVPPNLVPSRKAARGDDPSMYQRYCGVAMSPADPRTLNIWEVAMRAMIETYPEADSYGFVTTEHSPDLRDPAIRAILRDHAAERALLPSVAEIRRRGNVMISNSDQLDSDFLQIYLSAELVKRLRRDNPRVPLGILTLFRGYKLKVMDAMIPKDVWLGNMEECATTKSTMNFYAGITGRDLFVVPRMTDDGDEFHMQLNAHEYDQDEIFSGAAKYGLAGIEGQGLHFRNAEYDIRYLAEGCWDSQIQPQPFYRRLLGRIYGEKALPDVMAAFMLLEHNEEAMVYWGRSEIFKAFEDFSPLPDFRSNVDYKSTPPLIYRKQFERIDEAADERAAGGSTPLSREILERAINAKWADGDFWRWRDVIATPHAAERKLTEGGYYEQRAQECRRAGKALLAARASVLPGSRSELEYVIDKTEGLADYFDVLNECYDATVLLDRAWLGLVNGDWAEFRARLRECDETLKIADRLSRLQAGEMIGYADLPTEKYLILRYNRNVIRPIEKEESFVKKVMSFAAAGPRPIETAR